MAAMQLEARDFAARFRGFSEIHANIGAPSEPEGAAGSLYVTVPVQVYGRIAANGKPWYALRQVTLRRVNDVPGSTDRDRYYWRDVGTIDSFFDAHRDLISTLPIFNLYNTEWPVYTSYGPQPPVKLVQGANGSPAAMDEKIEAGFEKGFSEWERNDLRIVNYREKELSDADAHDLVVRSMDADAVAPSALPRVLKEYREPWHEEFMPRAAWSLYNAFTEVMKGLPHLLPERTRALTRCFDEELGIA